MVVLEIIVMAAFYATYEKLIDRRIDVLEAFFGKLSNIVRYF